MFGDCRVDVEFTRCSGDGKNAAVATVDDMARTNFAPDSNRDNRELRVRDCAHYRSIALFAPDEPIRHTLVICAMSDTTEIDQRLIVVNSQRFSF